MIITGSNKKKVVTFAELLILALILSNVAAASTCLNPGASESKKNIGVSSVPSEPTLSAILSNSGINLDILNDQENYADWNLNSDSVKLKVGLVDGYTALNELFGYYDYSNPATFVPLFKTKESIEYSNVPLLSKGEKISVTIKDSDKIKFAIKHLATSNYPEGITDNSVIYKSGDEYIFGFEDWTDNDFQDMVANAEVLRCEHDNERNNKKEIKIIGGDFCDPLWKCGEWSECVDGIQRRTCEDANLCEAAFNKPAEAQGCAAQLNDVTELTKVEKGFNYLFWLLIGIGIILLLIIVVLIVKR